MSISSGKSQRNQTLECLKLFAAVFIVYAHVGLPGRAGRVIDCLVRFSVPLFFAISGYFAYQVRCAKLFRRLLHVIKLNLLAVFSLVLWNCLFAARQGNSMTEALRSEIPTIRQLFSWFLLHNNPIGGHLWYLAAIAACYAVLTIYAGFFAEERIDYRPLYFLSTVLFCIRLAATDMMNCIGLGVPFFHFRDGWFYGIPMFTLGIFLRQYQSRIISNYRLTTKKLLLILLFGIALSIMQVYSYGSSELPVGAVVQVIALLLLSILHPTVDRGSAAIRAVVSSFGLLSTTIYILQFCAYDFYAHAVVRWVSAQLGGLEIYLRPLLISMLAGIVGLVLFAAQRIFKRLRA